MFFCSPLWLMSSASALLAPSARTATAVADRAERRVLLALLHGIRMAFSFVGVHACYAPRGRATGEASHARPGRIPKTCAVSALRLLGSAIGLGCQAGYTVEQGGEMTLVCAAHAERDLDDRETGRVEEFLGPFDPAADHVLVRCNANGPAEQMREVMRADAERCGYARQREVLAKVTVDKCQRLLYLAHRQTSPVMRFGRFKEDTPLPRGRPSTCRQRNSLRLPRNLPEAVPAPVVLRALDPLLRARHEVPPDEARAVHL